MHAHGGLLLKLRFGWLRINKDEYQWEDWQKIHLWLAAAVICRLVFVPDLGGKNGGVLSMRMQVILDSSFARPGSVSIWRGKKGEFRDWTSLN